MSQNDDFSDVNPFRALSRTLFRQKAAPAHGGHRRPARCKRKAAVATPIDDDADCQLFLNALGEPFLGDAQAVERSTGKGTVRAPDAAHETPAPFRLEDRRTFKNLLRQQGGAASEGSGEEQRALSQDVRALSEEDIFAGAMRGVQPLEGKGRDIPRLPRSERTMRAAQSLQELLEGHLEFALTMSGEYLEGYVVGLDESIMNKLRAGQYSPEAYLDLHGLNAMQAFQALVGFFRGAWYKGMRTLLVVPGRGRNSPDGIGVLRAKLQEWLTQEPFKRVVLAFCSAKPADGGAGSVYILLRKYRKKGKICWERMPADPDLF